MDERKLTAPIKVPVDPPTKIEENSEEFYDLSARFGDGNVAKMVADYSKQVDDAIPKAESLAKDGKVSEAIDSLYSLEKQSRLDCDMKSNSRILRTMVQLAFEGEAWSLLNDLIVLLCKKRSIIKFAIKNMIQDCCAFVDKINNIEVKNNLIETLRTVTSGKIYVEVERARLTKRVVEQLESEGKLDEAKAMIMELNVETYGSMEIKEKINYLLYQMRLNITQQDFLRASFIARKISTKYFDNDAEEVQNLKLEYFKYMIQIGQHNESYLDVCRYYRAVLETPKIQSDSKTIIETLKCVILYILLSPYTNEQSDLIHRINQIRELELIPEYKELLELFINQEIIPWKATILKKYEALFRQAIQASQSYNVVSTNNYDQKLLERLRDRVGEHNVRMVAKYYTQLSFDRMAELLEFPIDEMEKFVCNLIVSGVIPEVKINRPLRIIQLQVRKESIDTLDQWGSNVKKLTDILNQMSHLILKEEMVHKHLEIVNGRH